MDASSSPSPRAGAGAAGKSIRRLPTFHFLLLAALLFPTATSSGGADDPWGIWNYNSSPNPVEHPQLKGIVKGNLNKFTWKTLEPDSDRWDWTGFDRRIRETTQANALYSIVLVYTGDAAPDWIYQSGVPKVRVEFRGQTESYPYYLDENYQRYFRRMVSRVAEHIAACPEPMRGRIIAVQAAIGASGDPNNYKGKLLDEHYNITSRQWQTFTRQMAQHFYDTYAPTDPPIHVLYNTSNHDDSPLEAHLSSLPRITWRKSTRGASKYQYFDELQRVISTMTQRNTPHGGQFIRSRAETSVTKTNEGWWEEAPLWNMHFLNLWQLHYGLDMFMCPGRLLLDERFHDDFRFFNAYAGMKNPATSPGAFCALRDGLDAADTSRFPESRFGDADVKNLDRYLKIAAAFAHRGAIQADPPSATDVWADTSAKALNDVGWRVYAGNYQRYLIQHDPAATSIGWWRVGSKDEKYGRFARGFDHAAGKDMMYFDLDDGFFGNKPLNGVSSVGVRVIYFDQGNGRWALKYDAVGQAGKTALTIKKTDTARWKEVRATLSDAAFANRLPNGTDLMLVNTDGEDDVFHMIEVTRNP